jgi:hypothetical protein
MKSSNSKNLREEINRIRSAAKNAGFKATKLDESSVIQYSKSMLFEQRK